MLRRRLWVTRGSQELDFGWPEQPWEDARPTPDRQTDPRNSRKQPASNPTRATRVSILTDSARAIICTTRCRAPRRPCRESHAPLATAQYIPAPIHTEVLGPKSVWQSTPTPGRPILCSNAECLDREATTTRRAIPRRNPQAPRGSLAMRPCLAFTCTCRSQKFGLRLSIASPPDPKATPHRAKTDQRTTGRPGGGGGCGGWIGECGG